MLRCRLFLTLVPTNIKLTSFFLQLFGVVESYTTDCCIQSLSMRIYKHIISQGSVDTQLRCGGMFNNECIANLLVSLSMKKF